MFTVIAPVKSVLNIHIIRKELLFFIDAECIYSELELLLILVQFSRYGSI